MAFCLSSTTYKVKIPSEKIEIMQQQKNQKTSLGKKIHKNIKFKEICKFFVPFLMLLEHGKSAMFGGAKLTVTINLKHASKSYSISIDKYKLGHLLGMQCTRKYL